MVRDTDGDDVADEYIKVFTDLGNIEHGLHGLNWAPDGKLYQLPDQQFANLYWFRKDWFDKPVPAVFVYEAPPTARAYIKGGRKQDSADATCKLLTPAKYDIAAPGYLKLPSAGD